MLDPSEPWGISWQAFGILYALGLVLIWVLLWLTRRRGRRGTLPSPLPKLRIEQVAYLHGGAWRVAETVVARLLFQRKLQARLREGFCTIGDSSGAGDLFDKALVAARSPIQLDALLTTLAASVERLPIVETLREHGLVSSARIMALRKWGPHALLLAWLVLGIVWCVVSAQQPEPAGSTDLIPVLPTLLAGGFTFVSLFMDNSAYLTPAGAALVHAHQQARKGAGAREILARYGPWLRRAEGAVAISGLGDYPDQHVQEVLRSCGGPSVHGGGL